MSLASVMRAEAALLVPTYDRYQVLLRKGRGVYVYDDAGRAYLDFLSGHRRERARLRASRHPQGDWPSRPTS